MDELKLYETIKQNGIPGLFFCGIYFIAKTLIYQWNKKQGTTYEDIKEKMNILEKDFRTHLEKEASEDILLGKMEKDIEFQNSRQVKTEEQIEKIFTMLSDIKTFLIQKRL